MSEMKQGKPILFLCPLCGKKVKETVEWCRGCKRWIFPVQMPVEMQTKKPEAPEPVEVEAGAELFF
ncbi:MAG: hypothetical protein ACLQF0_01370 [Dissulfurispiraceae bacterium]